MCVFLSFEFEVKPEFLRKTAFNVLFKPMLHSSSTYSVHYFDYWNVEQQLTDFFFNYIKDGWRKIFF